MLHEVIDAFRQMDEILSEINKKNTRYQRAAINRARFLLSSGEDVRGQLKDILIYLNERITEKKLDYNAVYELEEMDRLIKLFPGSIWIRIPCMRRWKERKNLYRRSWKASKRMRSCGKKNAGGWKRSWRGY